MQKRVDRKAVMSARDRPANSAEGASAAGLVGLLASSAEQLTYHAVLHGVDSQGRASKMEPSRHKTERLPAGGGPSAHPSAMKFGPHTNRDAFSQADLSRNNPAKPGMMISASASKSLFKNEKLGAESHQAAQSERDPAPSQGDQQALRLALEEESLKIFQNQDIQSTHRALAPKTPYSLRPRAQHLYGLAGAGARQSFVGTAGDGAQALRGDAAHMRLQLPQRPGHQDGLPRCSEAAGVVLKGSNGYVPRRRFAT